MDEMILYRNGIMQHGYATMTDRAGPVVMGPAPLKPAATSMMQRPKPCLCPQHRAQMTPR